MAQEMHKRNRKRFIISFIVILTIIAILNMPTFTVRGVNGVSSRLEMPLYVKWTQFLARHYEYARIARYITAS